MFDRDVTPAENGSFRNRQPETRCRRRPTNRIWELWLILGGICLAGLWTGCQGQAPTGNSADAKPRGEQKLKVAATVGMVADLLRAVGGDRIEVDQLLGAGVDPHLYKPSRDDVRRIMAADLVAYSGLMLEGKLNDTLEKLAATQAVIAVTSRLPAERLLQPEGSGGHPDPHVWMDVSLWSKCLDTVTAKLTELAPQYGHEFSARAEAYRQRLADLHQYGLSRMAAIPPQNRVLITSHDAFEYFGRAYGVEVRGVQGISTESEAGLQHINSLVDLLVMRNIPAVFVESSVPRKSLEAVVEGAAAKGQTVVVAGPLYSDAMGEPGSGAETYPGMLKHNFDLIATALGAPPPAPQ